MKWPIKQIPSINSQKQEEKFLASTRLIWRVNGFSEYISCNQLVMQEIKRADCWGFFLFFSPGTVAFIKKASIGMSFTIDLKGSPRPTLQLSVFVYQLCLPKICFAKDFLIKTRNILEVDLW